MSAKTSLQKYMNGKFYIQEKKSCDNSKGKGWRFETRAFWLRTKNFMWNNAENVEEFVFCGKGAEIILSWNVISSIAIRVSLRYIRIPESVEFKCNIEARSGSFVKVI